jgi:hypothetical protein
MMCSTVFSDELGCDTDSAKCMLLPMIRTKASRSEWTVIKGIGSKNILSPRYLAVKLQSLPWPVCMLPYIA